MDARLSLVLTLPLALAACSSLPGQALPSNPSGLQIFEQLIDQPAASDSIIRQGDKVTYMVFPPKENPWLALFDVSCSEDSGIMYYQYNRQLYVFHARLDPANLPQPQLQVLLQSEQRRQACASRPAPDWRAVDTREGQDWPLLDRNSAVHEAGLLKVWTGRQLARYQLREEITRIPLVHERLAIDCAQQRFKRLSQFSIDGNGRVVAGGIAQNEPMTLAPVTEATSEQRRLIEAACGQPANWASLPIPPHREALPPQLDTPTAAPGVLAAIKLLDLPEPRLTLQQLQYRYDVQMSNIMGITDVQRNDVFSHDPQSGQLLVQATDSVPGGERRLTFRGLITLANNKFDLQRGGQTGDTLRITDLAFSGDWQQLPENTEVTYYKTQTNETQPVTTVVRCAIGIALPAIRIHPDLQGWAKPLTCRTLTDKNGGSERFNYLEDYGVFVQQEQDSKVQRQTWRVHSVR